MSTDLETTIEPGGESSQGLKRNALGLLGALVLGVVIMAPSLAIFTNWGFMIPNVGTATAAVFLLALVMSIPTAYSYALINTRMPSAGASYKWGSKLISPYVGIAVGLCTTLFYVFVIPYDLPAIGLLGTDLARNTSNGVFAGIMVAAFLLALPLVYRGINVNIDVSYVLVSIELIIVIVVAIGAYVTSSHSHASLAPVNPAKLPSATLLIPALVLGVLSFTGYDAISTVGEETKTPKKLIPRATIMAVLLVGAFWIVISTVLSDALPPSSYEAVINEGGFPLAAAANTAFGSAGRDILDVMGLEASFALLIAATIGATRILYAMGRDGVISPRFGRLHPKYRVPWFATTCVLAFAVAADVLVTIYLGIGYGVALWLSNFVVFFALVTYLMVNVCNTLLFRRHFLDEFHWFKNVVVPIVGICVTGYFMYKGFFEVLWDGDFKTGRSVVLVALALLLCTVAIAVAIARHPNKRAAARSDSFVDEVPPEEGQGQDQGVEPATAGGAASKG